MNHLRLASIVLVHAVAAAASLQAQGVVVDEGAFEVWVGGTAVGTEDFVIRRTGVGREDAFFANGTVQIETPSGTRIVRPLLRVEPPEGVLVSYQVTVSGDDALEARLTRGRGRYLATIRSAIGEEDREFPARADTRLIEADVAHHYYFLRDLREGRSASILELRTRRSLTATAGAWAEEDVQVGPDLVPGRRVTFGVAEDDVRTVWFDRQGRVLRVEVPARGYVAQRTDLVG